MLAAERCLRAMRRQTETSPRTPWFWQPGGERQGMGAPIPPGSPCSPHACRESFLPPYLWGAALRIQFSLAPVSSVKAVAVACVIHHQPQSVYTLDRYLQTARRVQT